MFQGLDYVPLLHARPAEVRAMQELPISTKRRFFPVVRLRPWLSAKSFSRAFEVVEDAVGDAAYGFDLDATKYDPASDKSAVLEFSALFDPAYGFSHYYDAVAEGQYRAPVFRGLNSGNPQTLVQLEHVKRINRGVIVRVQIENPGPYLDVAQACLDEGIGNVAFVFDAGWRQDVLLQIGLTAGLVNSLLDISEDFEIAVGASTFPDSFADGGAKFSRNISEVEFFSQIRAAVNRGNLTYSDWGSTRSPSEGGFARNVPRIDTSELDRWNFWRRDGDEDYQDIARRVIIDPLWDNDLDKWGNYIVKSTADGTDPQIKSPVMAAAARINLHLIAQAYRNNPSGFEAPDEPVGDDF
jgi:Beta protein